MEVDFLPIAQVELDDAFDWYEKQAIGLGYDLLDALNDTLRLVVSYPFLATDSCWQLLAKGIKPNFAADECR